MSSTNHDELTVAVFGAVEKELRHDAQKVEKHGKEDDLRYALGMVIRRVEELVSLFLVRCSILCYFSCCWVIEFHYISLQRICL